MKQQLFLFLLFLLGNLDLKAQQNDWGHYFNSLTINDMVEQDNRFWLATDQGLFTLNKSTSEVQHYHKSNSALPANHLQTISKDQVGNIWIGTYDLALVKVPAGSGTWEVVNYPTLLNGVVTYSSEVASNGHIWLGTNQGLLEYDGNTWSHHPATVGGMGVNTPVWSLAITSTNKIYAASFNLMSYENGTWTELRDTGITTASYGRAYVCMQNDSSVWYFSDGNIAFNYDGQAWQRWYYQDFSGTPTLPLEPSLSDLNMQITTDGKMYYNTWDKQLVYFDGQTWQIDSSLQGIGNVERVSEFYLEGNTAWVFERQEWAKRDANGITEGEFAFCRPFDHLTKFSNDNNGNLFFTNYWDGFYEIHGDNWTRTTANLPGNIAYEETTFDAENEKWFLARIDGQPVIIEQQGNNWIRHDSASTNGLLPTNPSVNDYFYYFYICANKDGVVWVIDENYNIYEYKNNVWSLRSLVSPNVYTSNFSADANGHFWWTEYLPNHGFSLRKFDGSSVSSYAYPESYAYLMAPEIDEAGNVWVFTASGNIAKFDGTNWTVMTYGNANTYPGKIEVKDAKIYVATGGEGVYVYDAGAWTNYNQNNSGLSNDGLRQMAFDELGNLWLTNDGFTVLDVWYLGLASGLLEPNADAAFSLYPNPVSDVLTLRGELQGGEHIRILNAQGQVVANHSAKAAAEQQISVADLASGVYWLQILAGNKQEAKAFVVD